MSFKSAVATVVARGLGYRFVISSTAPTGGAVVIGAPHTANIDFGLMLLIAWKANIPVRWLGKSQAFDNPFGFVPRLLGGIPVHRDAPKGMASALAEELRTTPGAVLIIAPEGTRKKTDRWKSGFYRIALDAGLPILPGFVDSSTKTLGVGQPLLPSGNAREDMDVLRAFYQGMTGWVPGRESRVWISMEEDEGATRA